MLPPGHKGEINVSLSAGGAGVALMRMSHDSLVLSFGSMAETRTVPYDAAAHRWWRFREEDGVLFLETSPVARDWTEQMKLMHQMDLSATQLMLNVIDTSLTDDFGAPQFDNVNVLP